jgi:hypothetical protein
MRLTRIHPPSSLEPAKRARQLQHGTAIELSSGSDKRGCRHICAETGNLGSCGLASPSPSALHCTAELEGFRGFAKLLATHLSTWGLPIGEGKDCQLRPVVDGHCRELRLRLGAVVLYVITLIVGLRLVWGKR